MFMEKQTCSYGNKLVRVNTMCFSTGTVLFRHFQPSLRGNSVVPAFPTLGLREHRCSATCFAGFEETTLSRCLVHWICANRVVSTILTLDLREQNCWGVCKVGSARTALFQRLQWRIRENRIVPAIGVRPARDRNPTGRGRRGPVV